MDDRSCGRRLHHLPQAPLGQGPCAAAQVLKVTDAWARRHHGGAGRAGPPGGAAAAAHGLLPTPASPLVLSPYPLCHDKVEGSELPSRLVLFPLYFVQSVAYVLSPCCHFRFQWVTMRHPGAGSSACAPLRGVEVYGASETPDFSVS